MLTVHANVTVVASMGPAEIGGIIYSLSQSVLDQLDLERAVASSVEYEASLLPENIALRSIATHQTEYAEWLAALLTTGLPVHKAEVLLARKSSRGRRPVSVMSTAEIATYQALSDSISGRISGIERQPGGFEAMQTGPLSGTNVDYVVMADVSSFYQYIDHQLLQSESVRRGGEADVPRALARLLQIIQDRTFGLPQDRRASQPLSELVIGRAERALIRAGFETWRHSDDFRIGCIDWPAATNALSLLDVELRQIGLTINEEKVYTPRIDTYREWAGERDRRLNEILEEQGIDVSWFSISGYDDTGESEPPENGELERNGDRLIQWWLNNHRGFRGRDNHIGSLLLKDGIRSLTMARSPIALPHSEKLVGESPENTHRLAQYIAAAGQRDPASAGITLDNLLSSDRVALDEWQLTWILDSASKIATTTPAAVDTAQPILESARSSLLRSKAAQVLASNGATTPEKLARYVGSIAPASLPELVAAAVRLGGAADPAVNAMIDGDPVLGWVAGDSRASPSQHPEAPF